ncbi:MAG: transketolase [Rhodothermales bacterium]|jgi:transketolase
MRNAFIEELIELATADLRIALLARERDEVSRRFAERFDERFHTIGEDEEDILGVATRLAEAGGIPFVFSSALPCDFAQPLPLRIVGVGGGLETVDGRAHHGLDDIARLRVLPDMRVIAPVDDAQTRNALRATWELPGPVYYRLSAAPAQTIPRLQGAFDPGRIAVLREGEDLAILATGNVAAEAHIAVEALASTGLSVAFAVAANLHPAPLESLLDFLETVPAVLTVESHYLNGGLGSLACETVAEFGLDCRVRRCGVRNMEPGTTGTAKYLHYRHGLSSMGLIASGRELVASVDYEP